MDVLLALLFFLFILIFGIIPFFILYSFSDFMRFIMHRVVRYRYDVIRENLEKSSVRNKYPDLEKLIKSVYKNLTDVLIEGIKAFTMTNRSVIKRYKIVNPELLDPYFEKGQSVMGLMAHFNNWEWGSLSAGSQLKHKIVALYLPLNNKYVDRFVRWIRARSGTTLASIFETSSTFSKYKHQKTFFILVADQSPSNKKKSYWVDFLGRKTAFLHGAERHSRFNELPVFFIDVQRLKRGYYTAEMTLLSDNPSKLGEGELTKLYANKLEQVIENNPGSWLWSHRRWKLTDTD